MTARATNSPGVERSFAPANSCAPGKGAETVTAGATTMAGSIGRAAQQLLPCMLAPLSAIPAQQACIALCAGCRQVSAGAARAPIKTMATAAR